jgi:hypothetical protein
MAKILDLVEDKVIISPEALALTYFNSLWIRDKSKDKSKAYKDIAYIYFFCTYGTPFFQYEENVRHEYIVKYVESIGINYKPDSKVLEAMELYKEHNVTVNMKMIIDAEIAVSKTGEYLRGVDYTKMDEQGRFLYDPKKVSDLIINMPKLQESLNKAKEIVLKEISTSSTNRGGASIAQFEE